MRRVAAYIYKKAGRWKQSIALSKKDKLYKDAMETCSQSGNRELAEDLLVYFIEQVDSFTPDDNFLKSLVDIVYFYKIKWWHFDIFRVRRNALPHVYSFVMISSGPMLLLSLPG